MRLSIEEKQEELKALRKKEKELSEELNILWDEYTDFAMDAREGLMNPSSQQGAVQDVTATQNLN